MLHATPEPEGLRAELGIDPTRASKTLWRVTGLALRHRRRFALAAGYNSELLGQNVARTLRLAYFEALQRLDFAFHDRVHSGDLITCGMLDLEGLRGFIAVGRQRSVQLALLLPTGALVLSRVDPIMAAVTLSFVPVVLWWAGRIGLRPRLAWNRLQQSMAVLTRVMEENRCPRYLR